MKNSAETKSDSGEKKSGKSGFGLFSISEHQLSLGLLVLLLLAGAGYGIWLVMAPFLPASAFSNDASRKSVANVLTRSGKWDEAIPIYREMVKDDPENGFATRRLAWIRVNQLDAKWRQLREIDATTGNGNASRELLEEEAELFKHATNRWRELLDNARYQRRAYERLAELHTYRSRQIGAPEELDNAVEVLKEMFDNGHLTFSGVEITFEILKNHPDFESLVRDEKQINKRVLDDKKMKELLRMPKLFWN